MKTSLCANVQLNRSNFDFNLKSSLTLFFHWALQLMKHAGRKNKRNGHQRQNAFILNQILLTRTMKNIWRTVRRICMLILGLKGLIAAYLPGCYRWKQRCENCLCKHKPSNTQSASQQESIANLMWSVISKVYSVGKIKIN